MSSSAVQTSAHPVSRTSGDRSPPHVAEAFKRDIPDADVRFVDTGHFALETHVQEIAAAIGEFFT
jgi:hypothetical protein